MRKVRLSVVNFFYSYWLHTVTAEKNLEVALVF